LTTLNYVDGISPQTTTSSDYPKCLINIMKGLFEVSLGKPLSIYLEISHY